MKGVKMSGHSYHLAPHTSAQHSITGYLPDIPTAHRKAKGLALARVVGSALRAFQQLVSEDKLFRNVQFETARTAKKAVRLTRSTFRKTLTRKVTGRLKTLNMKLPEEKTDIDKQI